MITSVSNPQVKRIIRLNQNKKARREEGLFTAEGLKMFFEAPADQIEKVYISEELSENEKILEKIAENDLLSETVSGQVFTKMSDTRTPQGVLTLLRKKEWKESDILDRKSPCIVILEDLQDPGNAGTIIRTAEGAGIAGVFLTKGSVDVWSPKVIRSTMGSIYRVPVISDADLSEVFIKLRERGIRSLAAHLKGKADYDRADLSGGTAFLIGNEANGLSEEAAEAADLLVRIPMEGKVESLNAAMAAGILMYEAARQRRTKGVTK